jgi:hypothetical protein
MITEKQWNQTILFYEELVSKYKEDYEPMLKLVHLISKSEYSATVFPHTSHYVLCLSFAETYDESQSVSMITIDYLGDSTFKLQFWQKPTQTHNMETTKVQYSEISVSIEALLLRLMSAFKKAKD